MSMSCLRWTARSALCAGIAIMGCSGGETPESQADPPPQVTAPAAGGASPVPMVMTDPSLSPMGGAGAQAPNASASAGMAAMPAPSTSAGASGAAVGAVAMPPEAKPFKAVIRVPGVLPNEEGTVCTQVRLDNAAATNVTKLHNTLSPASHHFIVSKVTDPLAGEEPVVPCTPFRGAVRGAPLTITQKHDDTVLLPEGVAYTVEAGQLMHLELHYINVSAGVLDVVAETELYPARENEPLQEATVMLIGTGDILIGPRQRVSTGPKFIPLPPGMEGVRFFAITGHTHRFGESVKVSSARDLGQPDTLLYDPQPFIWDAPEMKRLEPAAEVPAGGGFNFECTWVNSTDAIITFGESALAEMCFFWGYYYPKKPVTNVLLDGIDIGVFLGAI